MEVFLQNIGVGLRNIKDPFFDESYHVCKIFERKGVTVEDDEELCHEFIREFPCHATGCKAIFHTLVDFEMHYNSSHRYVCAECKKIHPNPRLLDIHIQETHDSFFQVLSLKQPMYQCYVSECDLKFLDSVERRHHCIGVHKFPKNFRFDNTQRYAKDESKDQMDVDKPTSNKEKTKSKNVQLNKNQKVKMFTAAAKIPMSTNYNVMEGQPASNTVASTSLAFIPRQVQKSYAKALTKNENNEKNVLETESIMELVESLPE